MPGMNSQLTHIRLVLECELTRGPVAVEMCCLLVPVHAVLCVAVLSSSEPEKALSLNCIVLPVVVEVHLDIRGADVDLVTAVTLDTVVVGLFLVMGTVHKLVTAVIHWCHSSEAILESFIHLLVPLAVPDHFFLLCKIFALAHWYRTVKMFTIVHIFAGVKPTFKA